MYIFLDTETTGLPRNWNAPVGNLANWPRLVQIAWLLIESEGHELSNASFLVRPEGYTIPRDATRIHGITQERALQDGIPLKEVLSAFVQALNEANVLVGHNVNFDRHIVGAELIRCGMKSMLFEKPAICTMKAATDYCRIPGPYGFKWPTLEQLHEKLFKTRLREMHEAEADVSTCAKCFFELQRLGIALG